MKTENHVPDDRQIPDDPIEGSRRIKREPDSHCQADRDFSCPTTTLNSNESNEADQSESYTVSTPKLKMVFDVEYRAPE